MMMPSFRRNYNMAVKNAIRRTDTLLLHLAVAQAAANRGNDRLLVDIQTGTASVDSVHEGSPGNASPEDSERMSNLLYVLSGRRGNSLGYAALSRSD